jgi:MFS family permease
MKRKWILPVIVFSQFCCTSLWFANNAVMSNLVSEFGLAPSSLGHLTSSVLFGFITGTLTFALMTVADRFPPSRVFFFSAFAGALFNLGMAMEWNSFTSLMIFRFFTGFFLAGIYPVGMKIAADYYEKGLGKSLGYLVGALVFGTAFPHLLSGFTGEFPWRLVLFITSSLSLLGGVFMWGMVPTGPFRKPRQRIQLTAWLDVFRDPRFRSAAFGYFGHMWELYAFWAFLPIILVTYARIHPETSLNVPFLSFLIIGVGGIACILGGYISEIFGTKATAFHFLLLSCGCCLFSPLLFYIDSSGLLLLFLILWGMTVVADSPLFSTLVAHNAIGESKGTALTIVNCIGFSITIISVQLINLFLETMSPRYVFMILAAGPLLGLISLNGKESKKRQESQVKSS